MATDAAQNRSFRGPVYWVIFALFGLLIGLAVGWVAPGTTGVPGTLPDEAAPHVVQIGPDGVRVERLPDGTIRPADAGSSGTGASAGAPRGAAATPHPAPVVPLWLCIPFGALLACIALLPFLAHSFWHAHYASIAFFLGALVLGYYLLAFGPPGRSELLHAAGEYYAFIALVGGLYVASAGILVDVRDRGTPMRNTLLLAVGAVLANVLGTTGASVLLIRPFMRMNRGRLRPVHVVFFIFIVSNCGGCLTPIGDPPLYLGFIKGVPFFWTLTHMWPMWLLVNGLLLAAFYVIDWRIGPMLDGAADRVPVFDLRDRSPIVVAGLGPIICLLLLIGGVLIDRLLRNTSFAGLPIGATFQVLMAAAAYLLAKPSVRHANQFTFEPVKEVGFLFAGIFLTMAPALGYLRESAGTLGLENPTQYYFYTGALSAALDNAPTYLSFLQVAAGTLHVPLSVDGLREFMVSSYELTHAGTTAAIPFKGQTLLEGISLGAVFFGAMTYIGNGPNFMVKSIVDATHAAATEPKAGPARRGLGTRTPTFVGYLAYALAILLPILMLNWLVFIR